MFAAAVRWSGAKLLGPQLTRLPARWVAPAVEASDYQNAVILHLEKYAIWEAANSRTAGAPIDERELQRMFLERFNGSLDRQRETLSKLLANVGVPCPRFQQIFIGVS